MLAVLATLFLALCGCFFLFSMLAFYLERDKLGTILIAIMIMLGSLIVAFGIIDSNEFTSECKAFCSEKGYSYEEVRVEGLDSYCVCDKSLESFLISRTERVVIE